MMDLSPSIESMTEPKPLLFAIVDIETNGGAPTGDNITEVAAVLHDGVREIDRWVQLIRPSSSIPSGITRLTGIDNSMVQDAPAFGEAAADLHQFLGDSVFVAHNVSFDLKHLQAGFKNAGLTYNPRRLCTVRMSRKWLKGPQRYSLGALCEFFGIENEAHHRAWGDAVATAELFAKLWKNHADDMAQEWGRGGGTSWWPPHLPPDALATIPSTPGVYRFLDSEGKLAYVGMSKNLASRVRQHFNGSGGEARSQKLRQMVHHVTWQETGSEWMAIVLEDVLIRRHHPPLNRAQKVVGKGWALDGFSCRQGISRFSLSKGGRATSLHRFRSKMEGETWLRKVVDDEGLNPAWSGLPGTAWKDGWLDNQAARALHNQRASAWLERFKAAKRQQNQTQVISLPPTPEGWVPELQLEQGKFKAYRFAGETENAEWIPDAGSGRIDAMMERYFSEGHAAHLEAEKASEG